LEEARKNYEVGKPQRKFFDVVPAAFSAPEAPSPELGLVVDGRTLSVIFQGGLEGKFLALTRHCRAVLCCRSTPLQKSMVVKLVRRQLRVMTLSIGTSIFSLTGERGKRVPSLGVMEMCGLCCVSYLSCLLSDRYGGKQHWMLFTDQ